ncbi:hypothetical protein MO973_05665 [Paenibacillus sp. TRM 82003]|nr:hypothetical protein [Paenibacillus sp. TRM 82003]
MSEKIEKQEDASASFGPETEFESDTSVSDKAFLQAESVNPVVTNAEEVLGEDSKDTLNVDEEFAAEFASAPATGGTRSSSNEEEAEPLPGATIGFAAIILAVLSFFVYPSVLGPASAVIGFMAFVKGRRALGVWSIALGIISFVSFLTNLQYGYY